MSLLSEFLEEIMLVADIDNVEDGDNRVLLMTLHSAKGLEFRWSISPAWRMDYSRLYDDRVR